MKMFLAHIALLFLLILPNSAQAETDNYEEIITQACALWEVPPRLALAVAQVESGLNPWAVNIGGRSYQPETREEALLLIDRAWKQGASFDVGLMQINSFWMRRFNLNPHLLLEPRNNAVMGVWILAQEIKRFGLNWKAIANYHTPVKKNPKRGKAYALSVIQQIRNFSE
jgi:soluble lytic murein transglycosylase-like protein